MDKISHIIDLTAKEIAIIHFALSMPIFRSHGELYKSNFSTEELNELTEFFAELRAETSPLESE